MTGSSSTASSRRSGVLLKIVFALVAIVGLGYLFIRSAGEVRAEPYTVPRAHLSGWTLALEPGSRPGDPILLLRPRAELMHGLFRQVFSRAMESMNMSTGAGIPLLLQGEYDSTFAGHVAPEALLSAARAAGLERAAMEPRCLGYKRQSEPGSTRQLYFALFDAPAALRFREDLLKLLPPGPAASSSFDPAAQSPLLFVATSGPASTTWLPMQAGADSDCVAPIVLE